MESGAVKFVKYPSLNGLRAISILFVITPHLAIQNGIFADVKAPWLIPVLDFLKSGDLGVNVFFVISGFLITSLLLQEEASTGTVSLKYFYLRRTLRIFPAYYFLLLVYFVLQLFHVITISNLSWLTAITYTKYLTWNLDWFTAHAWSLSIEEQFYLVWPFVFLRFRSFRVYFVLILIALVPSMRLLNFLQPGLLGFYIFNSFSIFIKTDAIAMGCLFALYKDEILKFISLHWKKVLYVSITILFIHSSILKILWDLGFIMAGNLYEIVIGTISSFFIALLMMYSVFGPQKGWFKFLNLRVINYIGMLSYSIYLWQQLFIYQSDCWLTQFPQNLGCVAFMALFSYYVIEAPFLRIKARFAAREKII